MDSLDCQYFKCCTSGKFEVKNGVKTWIMLPKGVLYVQKLGHPRIPEKGSKKILLKITCFSYLCRLEPIFEIIYLIIAHLISHGRFFSRLNKKSVCIQQRQIRRPIFWVSKSGFYCAKLGCAYLEMGCHARLLKHKSFAQKSAKNAVENYTVNSRIAPTMNGSYYHQIMFFPFSGLHFSCCVPSCSYLVYAMCDFRFLSKRRLGESLHSIQHGYDLFPALNDDCCHLLYHPLYYLSEKQR